MSTETYKVMVADDEYWIREELRALINWQEYGLIFMQPAVDGEDALEKITAETPDILILDINMPFLSGLELLGILRENYPQVVTVVLSGHSEFETVRQALLGGAVDYLRKPISKWDLIEVLNSAIESLCRYRDLSQEKEHKDKEIQMAFSMLEDKELSFLLFPEAPFGQGDLALPSDFDPQWVSFSILLIRMTHFPTVVKKHYGGSSAALSLKIKTIIRKCLSRKCIVFNNINCFSEFVIISDLSEPELDALANRLAASALFDMGINLSASQSHYAPGQLKTAYQEAKTAHMARPCEGGPLLIKSAQVNDLTPQNRGGPEMEKRLEKAIDDRNSRLTHQIIFEHSGLNRCQQCGWLLLELKQVVDRISGVLAAHLIKSKTMTGAFMVDSLLATLDKAVEEYQYSEVIAILKHLVDDIFENDRSFSSSKSVRDTVRQAIKYIDEHYFEELSLSGLSQRFHVDNAYFSKAFKKETGENLMVYIARLRVKRAGELMRTQPQLNLAEVAYQVGYDDYSYFCRVFKNVSKMTPREYRMSAKGENIS